tara:strand:- start:2488 stop:2826 length:339 start_codon:yes stop_codon:yes gene_type:complete
MAFTNGKLSDIVVVSAGSTAGIVTVASSKKVYVRSIAAYDVAGAGATAHVYVIPNGGSVEDNTKLFDITLQENETALIEPIYPIVLDTTGDQISVGATGGNINFFITGDKEA